MYRVEIAKKGNTTCHPVGKAKKHETAEEKRIEEGELHVGLAGRRAFGGKGRGFSWKHLRCWRVPKFIWEVLPAPTCTDPADFEDTLGYMGSVLEGFNELPDAEKKATIEHIMDSNNWAGFKPSPALLADIVRSHKDIDSVAARVKLERGSTRKRGVYGSMSSSSSGSYKHPRTRAEQRAVGA